jgi:hypothetical protein
VILVEEKQEFDPREVYVPRPIWQVWLARIGLVIVIVGVVLWLYSIATAGGL